MSKDRKDMDTTGGSKTKLTYPSPQRKDLEEQKADSTITVTPPPQKKCCVVYVCHERDGTG